MHTLLMLLGVVFAPYSNHLLCASCLLRWTIGCEQWNWFSRTWGYWSCHFALNPMADPISNAKISSYIWVSYFWWKGFCYLDPTKVCFSLNSIHFRMEMFLLFRKGSSFAKQQNNGCSLSFHFTSLSCLPISSHQKECGGGFACICVLMCFYWFKAKWQGIVALLCFVCLLLIPAWFLFIFLPIAIRQYCLKIKFSLLQ